MKIKKSPTIDQFFAQCQKNLASEDKNKFLYLIISKSTEKTIRREMKKCGFEEFQGKEDTWPSLYLSTADYLNNEYHKHLDLSRIKEKDFRLEKVIVEPDRLFLTKAIEKDPQRMLNDQLCLRALDKPYEATYLYQNDKLWMLDSPSEAFTNDPAAKKAKGKVLTFGLGIGYFSYMALLNPQVKQLTVIEKAPEVISLFNKYLLPQFPRKEIKIIEGDAFAYFKEDYLSEFDYIYVDIWQNNQDGLPLIEKLLQQAHPKDENLDFWIEDSCMETLWTLVYFYFFDLYHNTHSPIAKEYQTEVKKIKKYFESSRETITSVETLQYYLYDRSVLRQIAGIKLN
jgi:hypothetical protein